MVFARTKAQPSELAHQEHTPPPGPRGHDVCAVAVHAEDEGEGVWGNAFHGYARKISSES